MIYLGLDPGLSGAIAAILPSGEIELHDMPVLTVKSKQTLDYAGLAHVLRRYPSRGKCMAVIELVGAMPGQGVSSMFKFGQCYGAALATLASLQIPYETVTPVVWKRSYKLVGGEKDLSRSRALELFPTCVEYLRRKKDHGRAEALLLANYLKKQEQTMKIQESQKNQEHEEKIICPGCGEVESAIVSHTCPYWSYVHNCGKCGYTIIESEWDKAEEQS